MIGTYSGPVIRTIAFDVISGRLFGVFRRPAGGFDYSYDLYELDPATGASTLKGIVTAAGSEAEFNALGFGADGTL